MADHGQVEYAIATGNDLPAHESTYKNFILLAYVGSCHVASIVSDPGVRDSPFRRTSSGPAGTSRASCQLVRPVPIASGGRRRAPPLRRLA